MSAYKDEKTGKWYVFFYYKDYTGKNKGKTKRGFTTKREALDWEREFVLINSCDLEMPFRSFVTLYLSDLESRIKEHTMMFKKSIINDKLLPYFGEMKMNEIKPKDIIQWQNQTMNRISIHGEKYTPTYLKTIHNQLSAIFNHAVRYYELKSNPARKAGNMGKETTKEMLFWVKDEYLQFADAIKGDKRYFIAFELLFWCGLRTGELLALTRQDFDFQNKTVRINKSYQRLQKKDVITEPKTPKSNRTILMPDFLNEQMETYVNSIYKLKDNSRIFEFTKSNLHRMMDRGSVKSGVKRIRIHDLRHSHVSLLIEMGFEAVAIADRVGHESIDITYRYAHLWPSKQIEMATRLNVERGN